MSDYGEPCTIDKQQADVSNKINTSNYDSSTKQMLWTTILLEKKVYTNICLILGRKWVNIMNIMNIEERIPSSLYKQCEVWDNMIQYDTIWFNMIRCDSIRFDEIQWDSMRFDEIQWDSMRFNEIQWDSMRFNSIQYDSNSTWAPRFISYIHD